MSSFQQHGQSQQQQNSPNPPPGFGSEGWMTDPFGLAQPNSQTPVITDVGNGQKSSYKEQTYTLPGSMTYYESSG